VTYLLYMASVDLPPGYVAMALRPVDISRLSAAAPPLTEAQQAELRARLDAYATAPHERRTWDDVEDSISRQGRES
jgi:putative addiction module component (TIGR02574 family)